MPARPGLAGLLRRLEFKPVSIRNAPVKVLPSWGMGLPSRLSSLTRYLFCGSSPAIRNAGRGMLWYCSSL